MDSEDSVLKVSGGRDNEGKKKAKKKREKMISMDEFVAKHGDFGVKAPAPASSWAVMTENTEDEESNFKFDRSILPSAPKAAMEPTVDLSQIPAKGPFSAYIGNLSYDANEEDLQRLFCKLEVDNVRIITDGSRPRGYAYVDFVTKEALVEALSYNEREWMNRNIRVDLATDKNMEGGGRPGMQGGSNRSNEPDRTEGDWRRKDDTEAPSSNSDDRDSRGGRFGGDRERDRGYGFGRDRDGDRRGGGSWGDRDRGSGSSWGDRDRGSGSSWGDKDRGSGGAWGDRDRGSSYGDRDRGGYGGGRDRGYGGDRDRGFGGDRDRGYGGDRDRRGYGGDFGDRDGGRRGGGYDDRYGRRDNGYDRGQRSRDGSRDGGFDRDSDRGGRFGGSREDRGYNRRDIRPRSRDGSLEHKSDGAKERPVLKLQPRTKPVENKENLPESTGGHKPSASSIFGAAKPVDTYAKEKEIEEKLKKRVVDRDEPRRRDDDASRPRRSAEEDGGAGRRTSEDRVTSPTDHPKSPTSPKPADSQDKMIPAPPPTVNAWSKKVPASGAAGGSRDASNNAGAASSRREERRDDRRDDRKVIDIPPAGRGSRQGGDQHRDNKDRRPGGPRSNGDGSGGDHQPMKKHQREKKLPKSIDEMPKFEEDRSRDFSTGNKYAFLMDEDNDVGGDDDSNEDGGSGRKTAAPSS